MKENIDIDTKTFVRFWLVVIGFALTGLIIYRSLSALMIVGTAFFLAIALNPSVSRLARIFPSKSRVLGTALAYVAVILLLGTIIFLVVPPIIEQTVKFIQTVPSLIDSATTQYSGISELANKYNLQPQLNEFVDSLKSSTTQFATGVGTGLIASIGSIMSVITNTILVLVLTFLMLIEGPIWLKKAWGMYRDQNKMAHHRKMLYRMYSVVTGYVSGQLTVAAIAGLACGLAVFVISLSFNIPSNLAIPTAAIIFIMSLIPLFGAIISAVVMSIVLALSSPIAGLVFLIFFLTYQQIEANLISPKIQSKKIDLSALIILVSVIIGLVLFGIAGGIISIPIAGCVKILIEDRLEKMRDRRLQASK
jgi:predicted PurR-regulated permease PerM